MSARRLYAFLLLGWAWLASPLRRLFARGPKGLALFLANYDPRRLTVGQFGSPAGMPDRRGAHRCVACGRCDAGDGERITASGGVYPGTMSLMLSAASALELDAIREALAWISDDELAAKEAVCPARVPMRRVAALARRGD